MIFLFLYIVLLVVVFTFAKKLGDKLSSKHPSLKRPLEILGRVGVAGWWVATACLGYYIYTHQPISKAASIKKPSIEEQIVSLSPWSNYTDTSWLVFDEHGGFKIIVEPYSKEPKDIAVGRWSIDSNQSEIVLSSPAYSAKYQYLLEQDQAYLGSDPVENTPLKDLWISVLSSSDEEDSGPEYP